MHSPFSASNAQLSSSADGLEEALRQDPDSLQVGPSQVCDEEQDPSDGATLAALIVERVLISIVR